MVYGVGMELRDYQHRAVEEVKHRLALGKRRMVLSAPTGAGKTRIAAELVRLARAEGRRVVFLVPNLSLISQSIDMFIRGGVDHGDIGVIQGIHEMTNRSKPVQIATPQTLARRVLLPGQCGFFIIDECHKWFRDAYEKLLSDPAWEDTPFIGLSATPWSKGLGKHFVDGLITVSSLKSLIAGGTLSDFRVFSPGMKPDLSGVKMTAGDYQQDQLAKRVNKVDLVADVVETWLERAEGAPTLLFAVNVAHSKAIRDKFIEAGVTAVHLDAYSDVDDREAALRNQEFGDLSVICSVGIMTTGVDAPWVKCVQLVRPTRSIILFTQMLGRGLRTYPGKAECLVLDHSDSSQRLGFIDEINITGLDDGKGRYSQPSVPAEKLPKICKKCDFLKPPGSGLTCPNCGHVSKLPPSTIENKAGELTEMKRKGAKKRMTARETAMLNPANVLAQLTYLQRSRGYSEGWTAHKYKALSGDWPPNGLPEKTDPPDDWLLSWEKAQRIKWARGRGAMRSAV